MFNDELKTQVEDLVNKNLPALAAKEVVARLVRIDELEKKVKEMEASLKMGTDHLKEAQEKLFKVQDIESRERALISNEAKLKTEQKDFEYEKKILTLQLEHAKQSKQEMFTLSSIFFSSPVKTTLINKSYSDYSSNANSNNSGNENTTITEK